MIQKIIIAASFIFLCIVSYAHPEGHYHSGDGTVFNHWYLKNGNIVSGNFSRGQGNYFIIEQENAKYLMLCVDSLTKQDQLLANFKIKRFQRLNEQFVPQTVYEKKINYTKITISLLLVIFFMFLAKKIYNNSFRKNATDRFSFNTVIAILLMAFTLYACKKTTQNIVTTIPKSVPATMDAAFAPYKPLVTTNSDQNYFYVASNGFPNHNMMVGITSWQQQVPAPQNYTGSNSWSIPLQPVYAGTPVSTKTNFMKGAVAIAANGIPIFNALNNRGDDAYLVGELDNWGGHCGRADDYHYHAAPLHLNASSPNLPIAYALDGFAIYGSKEPDGNAMQSLDTCHGHIYNNGVYHYHGTTTYPYTIGAMKGKVTIDPTTTAPENQILPQAFATPFRQPGTPLNGAAITAFSLVGNNSYLLTYRRGTKNGSLAYNWNTANFYTFINTDTSGVVTTTTFQR